MISNSTMMTEMLLLLFRILRVSLLSPRVFNFFLSSLGGAPKIDLPLSQKPSHERHIIIMLRSPSYERRKLMILKALLMEGNITHILLKTKRVSLREISFKCMIMETNLTNLCTRLDIFSLPSIAPIFPLQS